MGCLFLNGMDGLFIYSKLKACRPALTMLKQCFTAMATTSTCEMCHIVGVTPKVRTLEDARGNKPLRAEFTITQEDYEESRRQICSPGEGKINFVLLGCPHYSLEDIRQAANYIERNKGTVEILRRAE